MNPDIVPYLWKGLNLKRYVPIRAIVWDKKNREVVLFMYSKEEGDAEPHWCLQYRGSGKYFTHFDDLHRYFRGKFKRKPRKIL